MTRRLVILALVLALIGAFAWALWPQPIMVDTATIARQSITVEVEEEGDGAVGHGGKSFFRVAGTIAPFAPASWGARGDTRPPRCRLAPAPFPRTRLPES